MLIFKVLAKSFVFFLLYSALGQQVAVAQIVGSSDAVTTSDSSQSAGTSSASDADSDDSAGSGSGQSSASSDVGSDSEGNNSIDEDIDFGFAVDPGFGVEPNPISGNAPGLVDDLKSSVEDLISERPTVGWNEVEDLEDYCADNPEICEAPVLFSASDNPLDFDQNDTLGPDELELEYVRLVDFHGYNTGFLIGAGSVVVETSLNFGGAVANDNDFGENGPSGLIDPQFSGIGFGALLITGEGSTLEAKNFLHFSTQCTNSSQGGCPDDGGNLNPIDSNDYIDIAGDLIVRGGSDQRGIRTFGGKDVFIVRPGAVVDVSKDIDLGGQDDQFIVGGKVSVVDGLRLGGGNDIFRVTEGGVFESGPDKKGTSNIAFSSGQDTLENAGTISTSWGIVFQGGASDDGDQLINLPSGEIQTYAGINFVDSGRGTIDNSGLIEVALENPDGRQIVFGDGDDRILNRAGGVIDVKGTINMGDGDDLIVNNGTLRVTRDIQMRGGDDWFALSGEGLELQNGSKVDGGEGLDQLVFSDQQFSSEVPDGVDASQQSSSGRILIDADEVVKRFVNFENAIQYKGSYEYQGDFSSNFERVTIRDGVMVVRDTEPVVFQNLELEQDGTIVVGLSKSDPSSRSSRSAPITVTSLSKSGGFTYQSGGKLVISADAQDDPQGTYSVIDGNVNNADQLAANTSLIYDCDLDSNTDCTEEKFSGVGESGGIETVFNDIYLKEGSLQLVVEAKESPILPDPNEPRDPSGPGSDDSGGTDDPGSSSDDPDQDGDGELDALPGCDVGSDLCDLISDVPGDEDDALPEEEDVIEDVFDSLVDGVQDDDVELPLIDYGTLARLVASGLAPRNVDAAGRGLALHNNLLVDAVFDRQPLRQFEELLVTEEVVEESVAEEEVVEEVPMQPLWLKAEELSDREATAYVEVAVAQVDVEAADADVVSFVDLQDDELDLAKRDGVSAWVKGFGGNSRADDSSILYNDYDLTA